MYKLSSAISSIPLSLPPASLLIFCVIGNFSYAADDWICKRESSQIQGSSVLACGIGIGKDENEARLKAFDNAKEEFERICAASDSCRNHDVSVEPQRTTCNKEDKLFKCYRMLAFQIGKPRPTTGGKPQGTAISGAKVRKGMTKAQFVSAFGIPSHTLDTYNMGYGKEQSIYYYDGPFCAFNMSSCSVTIMDGKVLKYDDFKPEMTNEF